MRLSPPSTIDRGAWVGVIMGTILYFIKEAVRGFLHAKIMTSVAIATVAVTLFFLGLILVGYHNVQAWYRSAEKESAVSLFLQDTVSGDAAVLAAMVERVRSFPQVAVVVVVDKEDAWRHFERLYGSEMLDAVNDNPLPASLEITLGANYRSAAALDKLQRELERLPGVDGIRFAREWIGKLDKIRTWFTVGTIPLALVLLLALYYMIANTIKLTIYARRDLVRNMHFVGATDSYIKTPFILEGMLQGLIGGGLGVAGLLIVRYALVRFSVDWGPGYLLFQIIFLVGVVFGCLGSWSAVRKFLA
jgi:cell division transport system permease protein